MTTTCNQCGAVLSERDAFCTKCGARRSDAGGPSAGWRFCTKCGAPLLGETKFCTKCGAAAGVAAAAPISATAGGKDSAETSATAASTSAATRVTPQAAASSGKSAAGIPKAAIIGGAAVVMVLVLVVAITGFIHAAHRAREKAQEMEAAQNFSKSLADLASSGESAAPSGNIPSSDINKSINQLAAAASALAQNMQAQNGANPQNALLGSNGTSTGAASAPGINGGSSPPAGFKSATSAAGSRSIWAAGDDLYKRLGDLQRDAPDQKASDAVDALVSKLEQLTTAVERDPNDSAAKENLNKGLADIAAAADKLTPAFVAGTDAALIPPPVPSGPPLVPIAGTGNPKHDWPLEYERTVGGPEADLVVRTGDINNLGFGWPQGFDPFSGQSTPVHAFPDIHHIPPNAPPGTDRIMIGTGVTPVHMHIEHIPGKLDRIIIDSVTATTPGDGYSWSLDACYGLRPSIPRLPQTTDHIQLPPGMSDDVLWANTSEAAECTRDRTLTMPMPIVLDVGKLPSKINTVLVQIFADDFQAPVYHSYFQVSLNGTRIPSFEYVINSLDQSGPIGKLVTMRLLPEYWPLLKTGTVKLLIDDPTTHVQDGYAVDFVRILVNPRKFKYQVSLSAHVTDADKHTPIAGATVTAGLGSAATDKAGKCRLTGIPAGLVVATADAPGYDENSVPVDLPSGQSGNAEIQLHRHQETTAALEQSIAQTGSATIYGIHFDTNSPNFRPDSLPALNAVLGLIHNHPGSKWLISGHTDNQGNAAHNQTLSVARAKSVVAWLKQHGVDMSRLVPQGFGATRPVADNATANGRFLNRRVEVALAK